MPTYRFDATAFVLIDVEAATEQEACEIMAKICRDNPGGRPVDYEGSGTARLYLRGMQDTTLIDEVIN